MAPGLAERLRRLLPALWAGMLLCVALIATRAPFAVLDRPAAGLVVAHVFAHEAPASLAFGMALLLLARRQAAARASRAAGGSQFSADMALALAAIACTVVGYYVLQPMMVEARAGGGPIGFGALHGLSFGLFGLKTGLALALAWRATSAPAC